MVINSSDNVLRAGHTGLDNENVNNARPRLVE